MNRCSTQGRPAWAPRWLLLLALGVPAALWACSDNSWGPGDGDGDTDSDSDSDSDPPGCVDLDGDGYGRGCAAGPDCDDSDPARQTNCTVVDLGGSDEHPWSPTDENSSGVTLDEDGNLTLASYPEIEPAVWIANSTENTVSRLDARTGREIARYPAGLSWMSSARPMSEGCDMESRGNCPSRTAIDFRGDCWVANRAFGNQGTLTKIAGHLEDCVDRNGDGEIQTSSDLNDDGRIGLGGDEFYGEEDECVLFTVDVGGPNGVPRALAIAPDARGASSGGNAWVGMNLERRFAEVNGDTGEIVQYVTVPLNPYGAIASKYEGKVWATNAGWQSRLPDNPPGIAAIDFRTGEVSPRYDVRSTTGCVGTYGITVDAQSRVWVAGYPCNGDAFRYDPRDGSWMSVHMEGMGLPRGLVADGEGWVWMAHCGDCGRGNCGVVSRFGADDGSGVSQYYLPTGEDTIGVDLDAEGRIWVVSRGSDNAARIDPATGAVAEFPTGSGPYTYSDFTGHSLLLQFPRGYYRDVVEGCANAGWLYARWTGSTPGDTSIEVRVRTAENRIDLGAAAWIGPWRSSPADLQAPPGPVPSGRFMEVEVTLITMDEVARPTLESLEVSYECPVS